uniref:AMP-binding protein n=1 Tax=Nocardia carnea TaxID=37328 RepID=UPI002458C695
MRAVSGAMDHLVWRRRADDALCVTDRNREWTYREFTACVDAAAAQLAAAGVRAGSVVAIVMANSAELLMALMAVWRVGAVAAPVDPAAGRARAEREVGAVGAVLVLDDMPVPGLPRRLGGASCISAEGLAPGGGGGGGGGPRAGGGGIRGGGLGGGGGGARGGGAPPPTAG